MKLPIIKQLVENHSLEELAQAEAAISEGETPAITVEGEDEGEQLTHAYAALWVKQKIEEGVEFSVALREFTKRVRGSIS